jgi:hypothetical protein
MPMNGAFNSPRPLLRPTNALLSPLFLVALFTLAINDHLLKGAGVLPGWLTGKLSDIAGLIVLPVVLAAICRVRSRRGVALAQAVSVAFLAGLKLSPWFATSWATLVGLVGIPWHNVVDPTDLVAVLALGPGWVWLVPAMERERRVWAGRRLAETVALGASSVFLVATSQAVCQNSTEEDAIVPNAQAPFYPGDLTGEEMLALLGGPRTLDVSYSPGTTTFTACAETSSNAATRLTADVDVARAVTRHHTVHVDEAKPTKDCQSKIEGTTVTVEAPVTVSTEDGRVLVNDQLVLTQSVDSSGNRTLQWTLDYWSDADPAALHDFLARLGLSSGGIVGAKVTWVLQPGGPMRGMVTLVHEAQYAECTVLAGAKE